MSGVFDAGITIWNPGMEKPETENAGCSAGEPTMTLSQLVRAKNERKSLLDIVIELERFLPDKLPRRATRSVSLTEAGRRFIAASNLRSLILARQSKD
jgi:hypothetical protein